MILTLLALLSVQPASPAIGQRTLETSQAPAGASLIPNANEDPLIAAAAAHPLGSAENPVRVGGPEGERAYLGRLRCAGGAPPRVGGRTQRGVGAFGSLVAAYRLECSGAGAVDVIMDMYHDEHRETRAPAGFTLLGA